MRGPLPDEPSEISEETVMRAAAPLPVPQAAAPTPPPAPKRWPLVLGAGCAAAVLGGALGFFVLTNIGQPNVLNSKAVASAALGIVKNDFGIADATDMSCPQGQPVKKNHTFVCTFKQGAHESSVQIVVTGKDGTYLVGGVPSEEDKKKK